MLTAFGGIDEAAVIGMKSELGILQPWALITARLPFNEAALRLHCQSHLFNSAVPVRFIVVDRLPRTDHGNIDRSRLPQVAAEMTAL